MWALGWNSGGGGIHVMHLFVLGRANVVFSVRDISFTFFWESMFFMNGNFIFSTFSEFFFSWMTSVNINGDTNTVSIEAIQSIVRKHGVPGKLLWMEISFQNNNSDWTWINCWKALSYFVQFFLFVVFWFFVIFFFVFIQLCPTCCNSKMLCFTRRTKDHTALKKCVSTILACLYFMKG